MQFIYKYPITSMPGHTYLKLPKGYQILKLDYDPNHNLNVWALVDTDNEKEEVCITLVGTGWPLEINPDKARYLNTINDNEYVWHGFEVKFEQTT